MINRIADLLEQHTEELAYLETLDNGKPFSISKAVDVGAAALARSATTRAGQTRSTARPTTSPCLEISTPTRCANPWASPR